MFNPPRRKRSRIAATSETPPPPPPPTTNTFNFRLRNGRELRLAITALADPEFNPTGLGRIDVDEMKGFEITVINSEKRNVGHLLITPSDFKTRFLCSKPIEGTIVNLAKIDRDFKEKDDIDMSDELTVFQVDGSGQITFLLTENLSASEGDEIRARKFYAEFLKDKPEIEKFPNTDRLCKGALEINDLELIIWSHPDLVFSSFIDNTATVEMQSEDEFLTNVHKFPREGDPVGMHYAWFRWNYGVMLKTLSTLAATCHLEIVGGHSNNIILGFTLTRDPVGVMEFMLEARYIWQ